MKKVAIIVPVFNTSLYLRECLDSIIAQTLKEIEIICINDGSTDNSLEILQQYAEMDDRIKIIDKKNTGYGNTMNIGIIEATAEYIGIVESDDFVSSDMFESLYSLAKEKDAEVVKSNYYELNHSKSIYFEQREILQGCKYNEVFSPLEDNTIFYKNLCIWSAIYKSDFIKKNKITFNETKGASYQDISFNFKVMALCKKLILMPNAYLNYRTDSVGSSVNNVDKIFCVCDEINEIWKFIELCNNDINKKKLTDIQVKLKVNLYIWNYYRLASVFQYTFFIKMSEEFKSDIDKGIMKKELFEQEKWDEIMEIADDGLSYFYKSCRDFKDSRLSSFVEPLNAYFYREGLIRILKKYEHTIIFGAGVLSRKVIKELTEDKGNVKITEIGVSDKEQNPEEIDGIRVYQIDELIKYNKKSIVFVAVMQKYQYDIIRKLQLLGFERIVTLSDNIRLCLFDPKMREINL